MKKVLVYSLMSVAVLGMIGATTIAVSATDNDGDQTHNPQKFEKKIQMNKGKIVGFFNEHNTERMEERLAQAGLTSDQITALQAKKEELREKYSSIKNLSKEERWAQMTILKTEMATWAEANGIDIKILGGYGKNSGERFNRSAHKNINCPNL